MENKKKKRKKFPKKIIAASLLAIVLIINFVYSSFENVQAKGMFASVETKAKEAAEGNGQIRLLEIMPDNESLSMLGMLIKGEEPFQDIIAEYSDEEIYEFAEMLNQYGIINMDSTTSAVYPLTYYKPGEQSTLVKTVPVLTDEEVGYGLSEQNLVNGYFQEVSAQEMESETVYYQEIIVTATPTPTPTVEPTLTPEVTETPIPTEGAEETVTPEPTQEAAVTATPEPEPTESTDEPVATPTEEAEATPTTEAEATPTSEPEEVTPTEEQEEATPVPEAAETISLHKDIRSSVVVAQSEVNEEENAEPTESADVTPDPTEAVTSTPTEEPTAVPTESLTEPENPLSEVYFDENGKRVYLKYSEEGCNSSTESGRFYRFVSEEEYNKLPAGELDRLYKGVGYEFVFKSRAEIRNNDLFKKFVLGITDETQLQNVDIQLDTYSVDGLTSIDFSNYDLVYMAQPIFYARNSEDGKRQIYEWQYADPKISAEDKQSVFSPWVTLAETQNNSIDIVAKKMVEGIINSTDPLKLVVDTSIIEEYERAYNFYTENAAKLTTGTVSEGLASIAANAEENAQVINSSGIYKALLMVAQDDFTTIIQGVCTLEDQTYVVDDELWNAEGLTDELLKNISADTAIFQTTGGHYVNKNVYFYKHISSNYSRTLCNVDAVSMLNGDFRSIFKKSILATQFADVVNAIDHENETNAYFESSREQMNAEEISTDMVLQYLLNYTGEAVEIKKNHISVLEIEPCADFSYDYVRGTDGKYVLDADGNKTMTDNQKAFIEKWINYFAQQERYSDVSFTCMSMQEFVGKNEDLNATYDMIYIGSNIGKFQTVNNDNVTRRFNDTSMNGLIYSHIGDTTGKSVTAGNGLGLLDTDYTDSNRTAYNASRRTIMRTTGNDLTTYKKRDLLNFLNSGYPVIVAENLLTYTTDSVSKKKVPAGINAEGQTQGGISDTSDTRTVYVRKPKSGFLDYWDNIYIHCWNSSGGTSDVQAIWNSSLSVGDYYVYVATIPKNYDKYQVYGKDGAGGEKGRTGDKEFKSNKDVCTITLRKSGTTADVTWADGAPGGASSNVTIDNSTYLYQLLKIATAQKGTVDVSKIERDTLNYDAMFNGIEFYWEDRTFPNLLSDSMDESEAHKVSPQYLNETKVYLNLTKQPTVYSYDTTYDNGKPVDESSVAYLTANSDGRYYLTYEFSISTLAGTLSTHTYDCQLFVDANFDGKFSENSEMLDSVVIKEASTGQVVTKAESDSAYQLKENTAYTLSRKLPKSFDGCINWKLQVTQNDNEDILAAETGYCAIPVSPKKQNGSTDTENLKQQINILQITSGNSTAEKSVRSTYNGTHVNLEQRLNVDDGSAWHNLLSKIPDFELNIKTVSAVDFANNCVAYDNSHSGNIGGYAINEGYDMIIVGFIDVFAEVGHGQQASYSMAESIIRFGNTGKSILFTHDTTAWNADYMKWAQLGPIDGYWEQQGWLNDAKNSSAYLTVAIRNLCGNDQYGVVTRKNDVTVNNSDYKSYINQFFETPASTGKEYSNTSAEWQELLSLGKDMAFKPNTNQQRVVGETQGSTYTNLRSYNYQFNDNNVAANDANYYVQYIKDLIPSKRNNTDMFDSASPTTEQFEIGKINDGAITEYPYILPDSFNVSSTHAQYWTVDIESDNNGDDESDLVVWYCINSRSVRGNGATAPADDFYAGTPNDVRNNYYIYNKGNITYSGAGHSPISNEQEIKLFINTMIAAYNAQIKVPEISIVESGEPEAPEIENIIMPYDTSVNSDDVDFVNFGTGDDGTEGQMKIYFNVYDGNLTARDKNIKIDSIFISDTEGTDHLEDENGNTINGRKYTADIGGMKIYDAVNDREAGYENLISGRTYYVYAPIGEIFKKDQSIQLYIQMHTEIGTGINLQTTPNASDSVTISRAEIFDLD